MSPLAIRVKAVCLITRGDEVLMSFAIDPDTGLRYGRFLGGAVEAGERADDAIRRELREELDVELRDVRRLGVVENLFASEHRRIHEIVFVFAASFAAQSLYTRETFVVNEAICDGPATWVPLERLRRREIPVYPDELVSLLQAANDGANPAGGSPV